jgi:hypothetical protein
MRALVLVLALVLAGCPKGGGESSGSSSAPLVNALVQVPDEAALPDGLTTKASGKGVALLAGEASATDLANAGCTVIVELGSDAAVAKVAGLGALMSVVQADPRPAAEFSGTLKLDRAPAVPSSPGLTIAPPAGDVATVRGPISGLPALLAQDWVVALELAQAVRKKSP